ncbi:helix-turn-helix domain-containing protein [Syntrophomonas wolfei]|uniref:helix-turn-helix domain-containing protein n=1 Tax=Syntrophomonas wolfei TaxID=863 RepID=UPI000773D1CB|nr:helix-turn-helix domain-containing protein [Syntrophomonas wolfei]
MMKTSPNHKNLLPFPTIVAASAGNIDAINAVLKHYEGYIAVLSIRRGYDQNGIPLRYVDEELRRRLEIKLIKKTLAFKVA